MNYIESNLMNNESVIYKAKLHRVVFLWPGIWLVIALSMFSSGDDSAAAAPVVILIAIITGIISLINYSTSEFGITTKRVLVKTGLIRRHSLEVLLAKVEGIQVHQGILGRILNYGSIIVSGTGGAREPFHKISDPLKFRKYAQEQISNAQDQMQ